MEAIQYKAFLAQLPALTKEQLVVVAKRASALQSLSKSKAAPEQEADWLLEGIRSELGSRGLPTPVRSFAAFAKDFQAYDRSAPLVRSFVQNHIPNLSRIELLALGTVLAHSLAQYITQWAPLSFRTLAQNLDKVPEALEKSFPGYLAANLLSMLLTTRRPK